MYETFVTVLTAALTILVLGTIIGTGLIAQSAYATVLEKDPGASGNTPEEEPKIPGWDPGYAEGEVLEQLHESGQTCIGCAKDFAPGQEALSNTTPSAPGLGPSEGLPVPQPPVSEGIPVPQPPVLESGDEVANNSGDASSKIVTEEEAAEEEAAEEEAEDAEFE